MSMHIARLLDRIKAADSRQQRDITMTVNEARDLHADITRLLLALEQVHQTVEKPQENTDIAITGGSF
jgi:hypothetical protein